MRLPARERFGLPGGVGIALIVFSLYFTLGILLPDETRLERLGAERDRLAAAAPGALGPGPGVLAVAAPVDALPDVLKQLQALADGSGLVVERAAYVLKAYDSTRRLEVSLPLLGSYPAIRSYLRAALALTPAASLDELSLQRTQASASGVTGQVRLSYLFVESPP